MTDDGPTTPSIEALEASVGEQRQSIIEYASTVIVVVNNDVEYESAMVEIINVRNRRKKAEKFFKDLLDPLNKVVNDMKLKIANALAPIKEKEDQLSTGIVAYATKKDEEAEAEKKRAEADRALELAEAMNSDEPAMPNPMPAPLYLPNQPASVKTGTHTGSVPKIPKWKFAAHPEINSDEDAPIYLDDPRAQGIDPRLFKLDRGRVTSWNKSKTPMQGIEHYYGRTVATGERRA